MLAIKCIKTYNKPFLSKNLCNSFIYSLFFNNCSINIYQSFSLSKYSKLMNFHFIEAVYLFLVTFV